MALVHLESGEVVREYPVGLHPDGVAWALPPDKDRIARVATPGFLGLYPAAVPDNSRQGEVGGVLVQDLHAKGGAVEAGIEPGDVVLRINGESLDGPADLAPTLASLRAGDVVTLDVRRSGRELRLDVCLAERPLW
ncbi:MAG: PDZ domain-containing protein [Planctomycetota bacterium]